MLGEILDTECIPVCGVVQLSVTHGLLQPLKRVLILHHKEIIWILLLMYLFLNKILVTISVLSAERGNCENSRGGLLTFARYYAY